MVLTSRLVLVDAPPPCIDGTTEAITIQDTVVVIPRSETGKTPHTSPHPLIPAPEVAGLSGLMQSERRQQCSHF